MDDKIVVKITAESDLSSAQLQMRDLTDEGKRLEQQMKDLAVQEEQDIKQLQKLGMATESTRRGYERERKALQEQINANEKNIATLKNSIKQYKAMDGAGQRMAMQLRSMREELMRMEEAGDNNSEAFVNLAIAAAKLQDQMGDTQQRIRILASDTKDLDAAMSVGAGLTGAFNAATSAVELFGGDMEGLQMAFYKVQAAMSILNGVQDVANFLNKDSTAMVVLNTAMEKLRAKQKLKTAAATTADTAATVADTAAKGAETVATETATTAQWSLNAAMAANPLGVVIAIVLTALAAIAALGVGIYKLVRAFSDAGQAEREYAKASKELEKIQAENATHEALRQQLHEQNLKKNSKAEQDELDAAKARNASELELANIKLKYAKKTNDETARYANEEIKRNNAEVAKLKEMRDAKAKQVNAERDGSKKQKKAREELKEAEENYIAAVQKGLDLAQQRTEAEQAEIEAAEELRQRREELTEQANQAQVDLMRDGAAKEIKQIELNYKEQLKTIQGNSEEEIRLRKLLESKKAKEIADIRKKYALQAQQTAIQEQKNLLTAMSQSNGTEADYEQEIALTKAIAEQEAQARIDALDKMVLGEDEYAAQVESIRLELQNTLKGIDNQEAERKAEQQKRLLALDVTFAQKEVDVLTGAEGAEAQKRAYNDLYNAKKEQLTQQAQLEIDAVNRSTDTEEVKTAKIIAINQQLNAELVDLKKENAQNLLAVDEQYVGDLQRTLTLAQDAVDQSQGFGKLDALQQRYDAEMALYDEQQRLLNSKYAEGLISYQEFQDQQLEIERNANAASATLQQEKIQVILDGFQTALGYMQQASDLVFEALNNNVQAELDALDEEYTTDAEEAAKNTNKKLIAEEEYERKKAELEMKQKKYAKAQALTNIGINTAMAIMTTLAQLGATPWGIAMAAVAGAMGAAQLAVAAAKPLAQYAKGRKGGQGEYALVGERGAEIMYVPEGASIIPHNKIGDQSAWGDYGVPRLTIPELPNTSMVTSSTEQQIIPLIDYDRLGEAVASRMPEHKSVSVNIDRNGIVVRDGNYTSRHLNYKYAGSWS